MTSQRSKCRESGHITDVSKDGEGDGNGLTRVGLAGDRQVVDGLDSGGPELYDHDAAAGKEHRLRLNSRLI